MAVRMHGGLAATATLFVASCELVGPLSGLSDDPDAAYRQTDSSVPAYDAPSVVPSDAAAAGDSPGEGSGGGPDATQTLDSGLLDAGPAASVDAPIEAPIDAPVGADASVDAGTPPCTLTSCAVPAVCVAGQCTPAQRVFLSSSTYTGNLGGHAGADATCQQLATAAGLG